MDWIQQWQSKLNKQNGLAALPYRNIHIHPGNALGHVCQP